MKQGAGGGSAKRFPHSIFETPGLHRKEDVSGLLIRELASHGS
jgi:hypothetical protein